MDRTLVVELGQSWSQEKKVTKVKVRCKVRVKGEGRR